VAISGKVMRAAVTVDGAVITGTSATGVTGTAMVTVKPRVILGHFQQRNFILPAALIDAIDAAGLAKRRLAFARGRIAQSAARAPAVPAFEDPMNRRGRDDARDHENDKKVNAHAARMVERPRNYCAASATAWSTSTDTSRDTPGSPIVTPTKMSAACMVILLCVMTMI